MATGLRLWIGLAAVLAAALPGAAQASDATATLEIEGEISPRCAISMGESQVSVVLTEAGGSRAIPFSVDCNQPLAVELRSLNGGLAHVSHARGDIYPGFTGFIPYQAAFSLAVNGAATVVVGSEAMRNAAGGATGVTPHQATGTLALTWPASGQSLLGGTYSDVIEIRVTGG